MNKHEFTIEELNSLEIKSFYGNWVVVTHNNKLFQVKSQNNDAFYLMEVGATTGQLLPNIRDVKNRIKHLAPKLWA